MTASNATEAMGGEAALEVCGGLTSKVAKAAAPFRMPDDGQALKLPKTINQPFQRAIRVLLVEDNPGDAMLVRIALGNTPTDGGGFAVRHVETLADALDYLADNSVDVTLLDLSLPDSFGMRTLTRVQEAAPMLPIVVLTGLDDPRVADYALEVGAQDFLIKGDSPAHMVERAIRYAISRMSSELERRTLVARLASERLQIAQELERARDTQMSLLPRADRIDPALTRHRLSVEGHFEPSSAIGGDMWGVADLGEAGVAFYAFDFSGHGISAALNVFRLHTLVNDHRELMGDPAAFLSCMNEGLHQLLERGQYATMVHCVVDAAADRLVWSAAGAPRPVLIDGRSTFFLDTAGLPLGIAARAEYHNRETRFRAGSSLLLYSDAMTEATDERDGFLGEAGLLDLVAAGLPDAGAGRLDRLLERLFSRTARPLADDLTAVWIARA
ncbi:MAG: PP2C family protein-serine/threonine phosphatase [Solirubrobacterales bacterium]